MQIQEYKDKFETIFKEKPTHFAYAPGRINVIGDNASYNSGHSISFCIQYGIHILLRLNEEPNSVIYSEKIDDFARFDIATLRKDHNIVSKRWSKIIQQTIKVYSRSAQVDMSNFHAYIFSQIPIGQGFSSLSALIIATYNLCQIVNNTNISIKKAVQDCMRISSMLNAKHLSEIDFITILNGAELTALHINHKSSQINPILINSDAGLCFLKVNTNIKLEDDQLQLQRREECDKACQLLGVKNLADFPAKSYKETDYGLMKYKNAFILSDNYPSYQRALHIIGENFRVLSIKASLSTSEWNWVGKAMWNSHECFSKNYKGSCEAIDELIKHTRDFRKHQHGLYGAKSIGLGFGGSILVLIEEKIVEMYLEYISSKYKLSSINFHKCIPSGGSIADHIIE